MCASNAPQDTLILIRHTGGVDPSVSMCDPPPPPTPSLPSGPSQLQRVNGFGPYVWWRQRRRIFFFIPR